MSRLLLLTAACLLAFGSPANLAFATDYFVVNNGAPNGGSGTVGSPWGTITEALGSGTGWVAGDRILVAAGTYDAAGGESFPLVLPDGVEIQGAGQALTFVDGGAAAAFRIDGNTLTSTLSQMAITANTGANRVVNIRYAPGGPQIFAPNDLHISSCTINGGLRGVDYSGAVDASAGTDDVAGITIKNCTFAGQSQQPLNLFLSSMTASQSVNVVVMGNNVSGNPSFETIFVGISGASGTCTMSVVSNTARSGFTGILAACRANGTGFVCNAVVASNNVMSATGVGLRVAISAQSGSGTMIADVSNNMAVSNFDGMEVVATASGSAVALITDGLVGVMHNACSSNSSAGALFGARGVLATASFNMTVRNNCFLNNAGTGVAFTAEAVDLVPPPPTPVLNISADVRQNVVMGNGRDGVRVSTSLTSGSGSPVFNMSGLFFGSLLAPGYNTFEGNATSTTGGTWYDFNVAGYSVAASSVSFSAIGNWWGTSSSNIETLIWDQDDSSSLADVLPLTAAPDDLTGFTATPASWAAVGDTITVSAASGTIFIPVIAKKTITVTMGGVPVTNLVVAPGGGSLSFQVPVGITLDDALLSITNPGGQVGTLLLAFVPPGIPPNILAFLLANSGGGGWCFVATAAFGDVNAPEVRLLRQWRDRCLATNPLGRQLVRAYYALSPDLAEAIAGSDTARVVSRAALTPVVGAVRLWMNAPWAFGLAGAALLLWLLRRRR